MSESDGHRRNRVRVPQIAFLCVVSLFLVSPILAQSPNGTINGRVLDPSGAVIVGAEIMIINDATRVQYAGKTNGEGIYVVTNLPPGAYRLQVAKQGFKTLIKPDIVLNVQDALAINFTLPIGAATETVTVEGGAPIVDTQSATVSTVIDRGFVESLPLNGRSFNTLLQLTPGVVIAGGANALTPGQFSIAGQRTDANNFSVDGVSANFGVNGNNGAGESGTGSAQAFSAIGGTSSLVSVEALQEFRVETSSYAPEFGRSPGGQVILTTRAGTNDFHGGVYEYFRNSVLDANDWFANQSGQPRAAERHNDFGAFLGGPILRGKTFFFVSYEGARLRLPQAGVIQVPYITSAVPACSASGVVAAILGAYPKPNGPVSSATCTGQFTGVWSNPATLDAGSVRVDHTFNSRFSIFGRYNEAPSEFSQRNNSLSSITSGPVNTRTGTLGFNAFLNSRMSNTFRANYSRQYAAGIDSVDSFGGAVPPPLSLLLGSLSPQNSIASLFAFDIGDQYAIGPLARNTSEQFNFVDDFSFVAGAHQMKYGVDYRTIELDAEPNQQQVYYQTLSVQDLISPGGIVFNMSTGTLASSRLRSQSLSLYAQDAWKISPRISLTYGIRWELAPAPEALGTTTLAAWTNVDTPSQIALASPRTPVWRTTYGNFAPRIGLAYMLTDSGDFVLRVGGGLFYDLGVGSVGNLASTFPHLALRNNPNTQLPIDPTPFLPVISTTPPYGNVDAFAPNLQLPRSYQWNLALEKSFGGKQVISATLVGQAGRDLLRQEGFFQPNPNFSNTLFVTLNDAWSNYDALQVQFRRPLSAHLQALVNYTWSHSLDNASNDVVAGLSNTVISGANDYASSNFDVRQSVSGALTFAVPAPAKSGPFVHLTQDWSIETVIVARSGFPFNAIVFGTSPAGFAVTTRPDLVPGQPLWVAAPSAPGGKMLNSAMDPVTGAFTGAFLPPSTVRQGTEGRNDIAGFGLTQVDLSIGRKFPITERLNLQFRADAFNVFNHPNFSNPSGNFTSGALADLQAASMLNQALGGLNPLFQEGGPRSLQLSLRLVF
jgi:hypothetical protein